MGESEISTEKEWVVDSGLWVNPFECEFTETEVAGEGSEEKLAEPGEYFLIDGPGINGMGSRWKERMEAHSAAGGWFTHRVRADRTLVHPERMWPGRGLEGKTVTIDGVVLSS